MNSSGQNAFQASTSDEVVAYPSWNPNSTMVAYWAMNGQDSEIRAYSLSNNISYYVAGSAPFAVQASAAWSPDGSQLAFFENSGLPQLMVFDFNTGVSTAVASANGSLLSVSWASNDRLVYSSAVGGYNEMMWVSLGTNQSGVLLGGESNFVAPSVGPNGSLSYYSDLTIATEPAQFLNGYGSYDIWTSAADGSNATFQFDTVLLSEAQPGVFTNVPYVPGAMDLTSPPAWSPGGNEIAYSASNPLFTALFIWNVGNWTTSSIGPVQLGVSALQPAWSPDGANIAFSCNLSGTYHIWAISAAGGTVTQQFPGY